MTNFTGCISPEAGRASDVFRITSMVEFCLQVLVLTSAVVFWYFQRHRIFFTRRSPGILVFFLIPVVSNILGSSLYRWFLNDPESPLSGCFLGNYMAALLGPTILIPNLVRIVSFRYRVKLQKALGNLQKQREKETVEMRRKERKNSLVADIDTKQSFVVQGPPVNPVFFKESLYTDTNTESSEKISKEMIRLKYRASSRFATELAIALFVLVLLIAFIYAAASCPVKAFNSDRCEVGFIYNFFALFLFVPFFIFCGLYIYFIRLCKEAPDLFGIKREQNFFMGLGVFGLTVTIMGAMDVGGFSKIDSEEDIDFRWIQVMDMILLVIVFYSVHVQIYFAIQFDKKLEQSSAALPLEEFLEMKEGYSLFESFLQSHFSVENLKVWSVMQRWKKRYENSDVHRRSTEARNIFRYWYDLENPNAVWINVSHENYLALKNAVNDPVRSQNARKNLFDDLLLEVFQLMERDSYMRFVRTKEYQVFIGLSDPKLSDANSEFL